MVSKPPHKPFPSLSVALTVFFMASPNQLCKAENLWDKAVETLSDEDKRNINFSRPERLDILGDVLKVVEK